MAQLAGFSRPHVIVEQGQNYVYDAGTLSWVPMIQPVIDTDTLNVTIPGTVAVTGPLTDAQLRATPVPVSGTVAVSSVGGSVAVTGPLTDAELRATAVEVDGSGVTQPVSGTFWQATQPVSVAATLATQRVRAATSNVTSVADTASSTTLLASNANRLGASIHNTSSAVLYVKFGTTASATDFTVRMAQYDYYEVPDGYTGRIDGIWATDPGDGAAKITELTA